MHEISTQTTGGRRIKQAWGREQRLQYGALILSSDPSPSQVRSKVEMVKKLSSDEMVYEERSSWSSELKLEWAELLNNTLQIKMYTAFYEIVSLLTQFIFLKQMFQSLNAQIIWLRLVKEKVRTRKPGFFLRCNFWESSFIKQRTLAAILEMQYFPSL